MLRTNKNITLSGTSEIGGVQVIFFNANISTSGGNASVSKTVTNSALYNANRTECRADIEAFEAAVYDIEDEMIAEETTTEGATV